jgi:7-keto-8-aminopelargonate synthetase-like enzyme
MPCVRNFGQTFPKIVGSNESALAAATSLADAGFLVPAIRFPTVPRGTARLRISVSAAHPPEAVDLLASAL